MLEAQAGPRYPALSSQAEFLAARESLVKVMPDRPEAWYLLGDQLFHWGTFIGLEDAHPQAAAAFSRALELDSLVYVEPLLHLVHIKAVEGDTAAMRRYATVAIASDSQGEAAEYLRWLLAFRLGDSTKQDARRLLVDSMSSNSLDLVYIWQILEGDADQDAQRAMTIFGARASAAEDRSTALRQQAYLALNAGHPATAKADLEQLSGPLRMHRIMALSSLYWDGDSAAAIAAANALARVADSPLARTGAERALQYQAICNVEQWRLWHGQATTAMRGISQLRHASAPADEEETVTPSLACAVLLDAMLAAVQRRPDAHRRLERLDSLMKTGPSGTWAELYCANLVVARLREAEGDLPAALAAVRRSSGPYYIGTQLFLTTYLREEGRLAAVTGDTTGAIRAYSKYLRFRSDPAPALRAQVDRVRAELARLVGEKH